MKSLAVLLRSIITLAAISLLMPPSTLLAQSLTSGDVSGTVLDPSGAAVPNATISLKK